MLEVTSFIFHRKDTYSMRINYILFFFWIANLHAQTDTTVVIMDINPTPVKIHSLSEGLSVQQFGEAELSRYQGASVGDLLQRESGVFIKQYGLGMLGTASNRGSGAAHTAILWEGVNILNPMLGQSDLSLLPIAFMDQVMVRNGGGSALEGNNAIGGAVNLRSTTDFHSGWQLKGQFQIGSFGDSRQQFRLGYGGKNYAGSLRAFYQRANNNFRYRDNNAFGYPKPWVRQSNSMQESWGVMQENSLKVGTSHFFDLKNWFQKSYRQIPPNLLQTIGDQEQQWDDAFRNILSWKYLDPKNRCHWTVKNAFILERLDYESQVLRSESRLFSNSTNFIFLKILSNIESVNSSILRINAEHLYQSAVSSTYAQGQHQLGLSVVYSKETPKWLLNLIGRAQWVDDKFLRPAIDINGRYKLLKERNDDSRTGFIHNVFLQAAVSYNYRYPTLNDRFWQPGGNPDLLPEYALSSDLSISIENQLGRYFWQNIALGGYSNYVEHWIQWSPDANSGFWRPQNIATVWARGMEGKWDLHIGKQDKKAIKMDVGASYYLNIAKRQQDLELDLQNKQLIYTPQHSVLGRFDLSWQHFSLSYRHNFNSLRYLDNANEEFLSGYQIGWLQARYVLKIKRISLDFQASVDNVWGAEYQVVANRAMPRQNFQLGVFVGW